MAKDKSKYHCGGELLGEEYINASHSPDEQKWAREYVNARYKCVDCGFSGQLNTQITYRGNDYICFDCAEKDRQGRRQVSLMARFGKRKRGIER